MENRSENNIPEFKNVSGRSLMVYTFPDKDEVIHYQLQMLANNSIPGILKAGSISLDGEIQLQFDITSVVPIKKLMERRKIGRTDFLNLIRNIVTMVDGTDQYLLDAERIVYDSRYIFADPQDLKLGFAYLPVKTKEHSADSLKNFLLSLMIQDIQFANEQSDNFVQKLLELLKTEDFNISGLKAYLKETGIDSQPAIEPPSARIWPVITEKKPEQPNQNDLKPVIKISKLGYPTRSYIIMCSVAAALILFCLALITTGIMSPGNPDSLLSLFGFLMIGGAVTYLVYTKLFSPDKKIEKIALPHKVEYVNKAFTVPIPPYGNMQGHHANKATNTAGSGTMPEARAAIQETAFNRPKSFGPVSAENLLPLHTRNVVSYKNNVQAIADKHRDKTVILDCGRLKIPHLKKKLGNSLETIILNNFPFMLGRFESQVDHCINNPAIGKLHAELRKTQEGYVISDMNSLNGTFVNGERLQPGQDKVIKNGDRITLGNEEFMFCDE